MKREIKALVDGGSAKPMPPLGPALSAAKLPVNEVIAKINEATKSFSGMKVPVTIIYEGSNYEIVVETPPITELIKKEAKIEKGASNKDQIAGNITMDKLIELAKSTSSNSKSVKARLKELIGTCQSIGITIDGKKPKEIKDI
jgi:large subunit ribosomal protein L11